MPELPASPTLAELGEWELIRRLGRFAPPGQFQDDAALLQPWPGGELVVNTDVLVDGVHFSDLTTGPEDVGWRAAAANLSDLAAMGCREVLGLTVGLVAPPTTPWSWVEGVYGGLAAALQRYGGVLLGGDCSGGDQRLLAITALGRLDSRHGPPGAHQAGAAPPTSAGPIRRADGRPGDLLLSTGPHGLSRLGLALLQELNDSPGASNSSQANLAERAGQELVATAIQAHRRPIPRFDALAALAASRPAHCPWRVAGCDSSDGLVAALAALAAASGCGARLKRGSLPMTAAMAHLSEAQDWCLGGGEDFELVLALTPAWAEALAAQLAGSQIIGSLVAATGGELLWSDGQPLARHTEGFRHFG
jgi:thiamine-monophosphate kinase